MRAAAALLIGEHDFSSFRAAECQALSPVKTMRAHRASTQRGAYWRFDFDANAFLHHMVRNIMGCLVAVGEGRQRAGLDGRGAGARAAATRRRRPSPPTACTSSARTTMRGMRFPSTRRPWTGCPDACHA